MKKSLSLILALVMLLGMMPMAAFATEEAEATETVAPEQIVDTDKLYNPIAINKGQLASSYDGSIIDSDIYGYVVNYSLKKGHVLSISDTNYVFSVRKWENGNYSTMLKQATTAKYTATEDMTVAMLIRKPDKSAVTAEELANIVIYDSQFGMIGVEGSVKRFTVEAETIDGGTATTRAAIFLPESYSDSGKPTRLVVMTNGHSAHLTNSVWNKNSAENVQVIQNYLNAGYAVWVVDNTAASTSQTPDLGCPQLVDSYFKAYEYIQNNLNVEQKFSVHARSFGTFAAIRIMREHPELVKCAVMTGSRVSIKAEWPGIKKAHVANRFGFTDTTGATYEADKLVGYDPYTDVNDATYSLPPTFWMLAEGDSTAKPSEFIEKLTTHGNDVTLKIYSDITHTGICTLNTSETFADALAYLEKHQAEAHTHTYENGICTSCGEEQPGPVIVTQPTDSEATLGETFCVTVEAEGEGLTYQWYFRNAGSDKWYKSGVTDNTYDDVMTTTRAGREVYCVITDANGKSVTTETATLVHKIVELEIVTQPANSEAILGENFCVTVEAQGEGLKYQWYFRNAGSEIWSKSGVRDNTYDDVMTTARAGREVYCIVTDAYGNSVTTDVATLIRVPVKLEITSQPTDATAAFGEMFCATVEANGEGLKYQWYFRNAGSDTWYKSGVRDNTYDDIMTTARNGREIYCVITDEYGNSVTTDVVKLTAVPKTPLQLLGQSYESAAMGERYCVTVEAQGEGLAYQWYFRNAGSDKWYKSSVRDNTYDDVMTKARANREVYCVITDAYGNQIVTEVVTLVLDN